MARRTRMPLVVGSLLLIIVSSPGTGMGSEQKAPGSATTGAQTKVTPDAFLKTEVSPREHAAIELLEKTKREILDGRKFNDLSTVGGAFLTCISVLRHEDEALLLTVAPSYTDFKLSSGEWSRLLDHLVRPAVVRRIEVGNETPKESDLCSVYTSDSPSNDIGQIWTFGFVEGAWRFLNCTVPTDPWMSIALKQESRTREILQKGVPQPRRDDGQATLSEEIAVVTGLPLTAEIVDWDIALETDLADNRLKMHATCTVRNTGPASLDHLDFDLLAAEKFYGMHVEIAKIARLSDGREENLAFKRFAEQPPRESSEAGTHECPLLTRVTLPAALKPGQDCRLAFDYTLLCPDIAQRYHYNLLWEPEKDKKEVCLIADFTWYPRLAVDLQRRMQLSGKKNFFLRGSKPAWQVTLTHPAGLESMVIDGKLEKTEQVGQQTVSRWKSIVGGNPQVFIGPAERIEKKGDHATVVFLLPRGKYDPEFVDSVAKLVNRAYAVFTDWFGPLGSNEVHIVSPSGIRGGHGAFLGMTIDASYFRRNRSERLTPSGEFFVETPVHELAHSWWGDTVSSYGRGTKFLRESLANFTTWHMAREYYGMDLFTPALRKGILDQARGAAPLFNPDSDDEGFAYVKGPLVLDMLRQEMGDDVFFRMLKEYVRRHRDGHATFIDFVSACNDVSQRDWMPFFYQWCYAKGCPGYRLVGFESKEGRNGWETSVTIRNSGSGIVRCPLELRMDGQTQQELFAIPGGREKTLLYVTARKVTGITIDPRQTVYQEDLTDKSNSTAYLAKSAGYGRASNRELASRYDKTWLEQLTDPQSLLKTGFALYDAKRYEEALAVFEKMGEKAGGNQGWRAMALIWQGHMLDLLGRRDEALGTYKRVAEMKLNSRVQHAQYGLSYECSSYAREKIATPFARVENRNDD